MYVINYKVQFTTRFLELESFSIFWGLLYIYTYMYINIHGTPTPRVYPFIEFIQRCRTRVYPFIEFIQRCRTGNM